MSRWEDDLLDDFLAETLGEEDARASELLAAASGALAPTPSLRDALLAAARVEGRFDRFAARIAELLDVSEARAKELLDGIARPESWTEGPAPGVELYHVQGGPRVEGAVTGFVRMSGGVVFPEHRHLGHESVLVVQGSLEDGVTGSIYRAGESTAMAAGSSHDFRARPGPALVYLVVLDEGVDIGGTVILAGDPRM